MRLRNTTIAWHPTQGQAFIDLAIKRKFNHPAMGFFPQKLIFIPLISDFVGLFLVLYSAPSRTSY
jgi:hypothetical protein